MGARSQRDNPAQHSDIRPYFWNGAATAVSCMTDSAESSNAPDSDKGAAYLPGQVIGDKYRLEKQVGEGGMASIWLATNFVLDVAVAVKLIRTDTAADDSGWRMLQEARAVARLGHPAIVRIFDFGEAQDGSPFIAMEYLHGETLADRLDREGSITAVKAVQLLLPIADGLAVAHGKGIVHRDLKPENIFLARDEASRLQPKLLDFGIAKLNDGPKGKVTLDGSLLGSPDYMAPEQAQGLDEVDHRADVWAMSVVLYEMLCGAPPFEGSNYNSLLRAIISDDPKPITVHQAGDDELWTILKTGLAKDPDERWEGIREFGEALAFWLYRRGVTEDICASSLTTTWLEAGHSGVSIRLSGRPPRIGVGPTSIPPESGPRPSSAKRADVATGPGRSAKMVSVVPRKAARRSGIKGAMLGGIATAVAIGLAIVLVYALSTTEPTEATVQSIGAAAPQEVSEPSGAETAAADDAPDPAASATTQASAATSADAPPDEANPPPKAGRQKPVAPRHRVIPPRNTKKKRPNEIDMGF